MAQKKLLWTLKIFLLSFSSQEILGLTLPTEWTLAGRINLNKMEIENRTRNQTIVLPEYWSCRVHRGNEQQGNCRLAKPRGRKRTPDLSPEMATTHKRRAVDSSGSSCGSTRSRELGSITEDCGSPSLRKVESKRPTKWSVMFTGLKMTSTDMEKISQLQGIVTESVTECSILVTDKVRRTTKFLSMVAKGVPIVSASWLDGSAAVGSSGFFFLLMV